MTARHPRRHRLMALPLGMALATAVAVLPHTAATAAPAAPAAPAKQAKAKGETLSYVVNTAPGLVTSKRVKDAIAQAQGTIVHTYDKIGVIVVHSADPDFARKLRKVPGVQSAGNTRHAPLSAQSTTDMGAPQVLGAEDLAAVDAAAGQDPLEPLQWDLPAIKADQAHKKNLGSPKVTVGVIDTGVDDTHPDLAPNFNRAASVNCVTGKPDTAAGAWRPGAGESAHGTHVAGEIAAAKNGVGMTGVAPGVKVAGIKVSTPDGYFYAEAVVCGFVWAADHGVDITNNSYYTDPWYFTCKNDPDQRAVLDAVTRATQYAERKGTLNVAAAGNENLDLAARTITDVDSPNDATPVEREVDTRVCFDIPTQSPGVVTVSSTGAKGVKSSFSNYGLGQVDIAAPGGDSTRYQTPDAPATSGLILGTLPGGQYGYMAGTSMAAPHVAAVAALIKSTHPKASPAKLKSLLFAQADETACTKPYDIDGDGTADAVCQGTKKFNGFYGHGIADALDAVTKK